METIESHAVNHSDRQTHGNHASELEGMVQNNAFLSEPEACHSRPASEILMDTERECSQLQAHDEDVLGAEIV